MAIKELKIILSLLIEISNSNIPKLADYEKILNESNNEIAKEKYYSYFETMNNDLIKGVDIRRGGSGNKVQMAILDHVKLTIKGIEFMNKYEDIVKLYPGLNSIEKWLSE